MSDFVELWLVLLMLFAAAAVFVAIVWAAWLVAFWLAVVVAVVLGSMVAAALATLAER